MCHCTSLLVFTHCGSTKSSVARDEKQAHEGQLVRLKEASTLWAQAAEAVKEDVIFDAISKRLIENEIDTWIQEQTEVPVELKCTLEFVSVTFRTHANNT